MIKWIMAHILKANYKTIKIAYGKYAFKKVYRIHLR